MEELSVVAGSSAPSGDWPSLFSHPTLLVAGDHW